MIMKKIISVLVLSCVLFSCKNKADKGEFTLTGDMKNTPDQRVFLEQLYFSEKNPEVVDTGLLEKGKFTVNASSPEQGLYRIRLEKNDGGFIFINDAKDIKFTADLANSNLDGPTFHTRANTLLKEFLLNLASISNSINESNSKIEQLRTTKNNDSAVTMEAGKITELNNRFKNYIIKYIDTASEPVVAMFALGYTRGIEPAEIKAAVTGMAKRFPEHQGVIGVVSQFNTMVAQPEQKPQAAANVPAVGSIAPDITMPDVNGKTFSLSELKGKYVLVDFWASWCGPCRGENPNLVEAYNKFKTKNFTVLGVSLDEDKDKWMKAIKDDKLAWKQISDLKQWSSAAVGLYGFDGIPYNVLVDPDGKIIATSLRGPDLHTKLAEVLAGQ